MTREEAIKRLEFLKGVYSVDTETALDMAIEALSANRPTVVHCRECVRKKNCWMFSEHKNDNGTCVWAEPYYITEKPNDIVEQKNDVVAEPTDLISRADAIEAVENNSYGMGSRASIKAIKALPSADRPSGEWVDDDGNNVPLDKEGYPLRSCHCNQCHEWLVGSDEYYTKGNYCPNCGAKMGSDTR